MIILIVIGAFCTATKELENWRKSEEHPSYSIVENGQNTEKSPGDFRGLAVT